MRNLSEEKMKKIALTGNIGTGKSFVLNCIKKYGVFVFDVDAIAKEVRMKKKKELMTLFNTIDEKELADLVFKDEEKLQSLENVLYPFIIEEMLCLFKLHENDVLVVVEVPLLYEKKWERYFDEVWVVASTKEKALKRLCVSRNMNQKEVMNRLNYQMPLEEKISKADEIVYNNDENVENQVKELLNKGGVACLKKKIY